MSTFCKTILKIVNDSIIFLEKKCDVSGRKQKRNAHQEGKTWYQFIK